MSRKQALSMYLLGTFGQVLGVSLLVWFLRAGGVKVDFTSPMGMIAIIVGGLSSAFGVVLPVLATINLVSNKF